MPHLTKEKFKAGIFDGPKIRELIRDAEFENSKNVEGVCFGPEELSLQQ